MNTFRDLNWVVRVVSRRIIWGLVLLGVVSIAVFVMVSLIPGNPAASILGEDATPASLQHLQQELGLNRPIYVQYYRWLSLAIRGNLGKSLLSGQSVTSILNARIPATLSLVVLTFVVIAVAGIGLGLLAAVRGGLVARLIDSLALVGFSIPNFWLAVLLIMFFSVQARLLPSIGFVSFSSSPWEWFTHMILPVASLAFGGVAFIAKLAKTEFVRVLELDFVMVLQANGFRWRNIVLKHVLRNASVAIVSGLGVQFIALLSGIVLVENIFSLPGIGSLAVTAVNEHDIPIIEGVAIYFTILVVFVNVLSEVSFAFLNPRILRVR